MGLEAYSNETWNMEPVETKGFYKKAYFGRYHEYYTDRYYMAVGPVEKVLEAELEREMVRKVNIWVPVYDDTCFNYCGEEENERLECKRTFCQALNETTLKEMKVKVEIECTSCKDGTLTGFFETSDQSTKLTFRTGHEVYPTPNPKEKIEKRNLYHMVGPVGFYRVKCTHGGGDEDYIQHENKHERWVSENIMIPCLLHKKLDSNKESVAAQIGEGTVPDVAKKSTKELMKVSLDWSLPNGEVSSISRSRRSSSPKAAKESVNLLNRAMGDAA